MQGRNAVDRKACYRCQTSCVWIPPHKNHLGTVDSQKVWLSKSKTGYTARYRPVSASCVYPDSTVLYVCWPRLTKTCTPKLSQEEAQGERPTRIAEPSAQTQGAGADQTVKSPLKVAFSSSVSTGMALS